MSFMMVPERQSRVPVSGETYNCSTARVRFDLVNQAGPYDATTTATIIIPEGAVITDIMMSRGVEVGGDNCSALVWIEPFVVTDYVGVLGTYVMCSDVGVTHWPMQWRLNADLTITVSVRFIVSGGFTRGIIGGGEVNVVYWI